MGEPEAKSPSAVTVGVPKRPPFLGVKKNQAILLLVVVIIIVAGIMFVEHFVHRSNALKTVAGQECSTGKNSSLLPQAASLLAPAQASQLHTVVMNIQKVPGYQQDSNCLYPVVVYYLNTFDAQNAALYMGKLNDVYKPKQGFSHYFSTDPQIASLRSQVSFLQLRATQAKQDDITFSEPKGN